MLDNSLLQEFVYGFYGYGTYSAPFWFIGMEEGGGRSLGEIQKRLRAWDARGRRELEDVPGYHRAIGITHFWDEPVKLQSTWKKLIRVLLSAKGRVPSSREVRDYQRSQLGNEHGETCLLELRPLPSPNVGKWFYGKNSNLPILVSRKRYIEEIAEVRIRHLRKMIDIHSPSWVLFYGSSDMKSWRQVVSIPLEMHGKDTFYAGKMGSTVMVVSKHPTAWGITNEYFHEVGNCISAVRGRT